jgi:general secretion pathway protein H
MKQLRNADCEMRIGRTHTIKPLQYVEGGIAVRNVSRRFAFSRPPIRTSQSALRTYSPGFTLLELVIVMALAVLVVGLAMLSFASAVPSARLTATGRDISSTIRQYRAVAQNKGEDQVLVINLDTKEFGIEGGTMRSIPDSISIKVTDPSSGEIHNGKYEIVMREDGSVEGGSIVLSYKRRTVTIQTDPVVGSIIL